MSTHAGSLGFLLIGGALIWGGCAGVRAGGDQLPAVQAGTEVPSAERAVVPASATEALPDTSTQAGSPAEQEDEGFELSDLAPKNLWKNVKAAAGYGPDEGVARQLYQQGQSLYAEKKYPEAAAKFRAAAKRWPDSLLEEDALFMEAQSYFYADQYAKAQDAFDHLLDKYDNSRYLDTAVKQLFAIGRYWEQLDEKDPHWPITPNLTDKERPWFDTFGNAIKCYETIRMKDPTGPLADDALMATATAYFRRGRFEDAAYYFGVLVNEYSDSEHQAQAHLLGLQSKLQVYQGPHYDRTPLEDAQKLADQALSQFPHELGPEKANVVRTRELITEQIAQRDWTLGQYYDKKKQYGAARVHYNWLIQEYPLTQAARKARQRLEQIRDLPDEPPKRFGWLTEVFERK